MHGQVLNITKVVRTKLNVLLFVIIINTVLVSVFPPCLLAYELTGYVQAEGKYFYGTEYVYNYVNSDGSQKNVPTNVKTDAASRSPDGSSWQTVAG